MKFLHIVDGNGFHWLRNSSGLLFNGACWTHADLSSYEIVDEMNLEEFTEFLNRQDSIVIGEVVSKVRRQEIVARK